MPAPSLQSMARSTLERNARDLVDIGVCPVHLLKSVLTRIENPEQLHLVEQNNPEVIGEVDEVWLNMIKRDIPDWDKKPHQPRDPKNWYKVYRKLKADAQAEMAAGEDRLKAALNLINTSREEGSARLVPNAAVPKRQVNRISKMRYNYQTGRTGSKGAHKMTLMEKIKRERSNAVSPRMSRPTHELVKISSRVQQAPSAMVHDLREERNFKSRPIAATTARPAMRGTTAPMHAPKTSLYDHTQDREARLRALKAGTQTDGSSTTAKPSGRPQQEHSSSASAPGLSVDFLENDDLDSADELFDEPPRAKPKPRAVTDLGSNTLKRKAPQVMISSPKKRSVHT